MTKPKRSLHTKTTKTVKRTTVKRRKPISSAKSPSVLASDIIKRSLASSSEWAKQCAGMRYVAKLFVTYNEVRVSCPDTRSRLRLDFVAITRWSFKKPKDVFGVEIKTSLADFESDAKWQQYLPYCNYFLFACPSDNTDLLATMQRVLPSSVGILVVGLTGIAVSRKPQRQEGTRVGAIYENLFERLVLGAAAVDDGSAGDRDD